VPSAARASGCYCFSPAARQSASTPTASLPPSTSRSPASRPHSAACSTKQPQSRRGRRAGDCCCRIRSSHRRPPRLRGLLQASSSSARRAACRGPGEPAATPPQRYLCRSAMVLTAARDPLTATSASWTDALTRASAVSWSRCRTPCRTPASRCRTGPAAAPPRSCSRPLFKRLRTGRGRPSGIMHSQCGPPRCRFSYAAR
jgi:hypothetical protein